MSQAGGLRQCLRINSSVVISQSDQSGESEINMFGGTRKHQEGRNALAYEILLKDNFKII